VTECPRSTPLGMSLLDPKLPSEGFVSQIDLNGGARCAVEQSLQVKAGEPVTGIGTNKGCEGIAPASSASSLAKAS